MMKAIIIAVLIGVSTAQVLVRGLCPRVTVQSNFDVNNYLGTWYEFERSPFIPERNLKCVKAEYRLEDGTFEVKNTGINKRNGRTATIDGIGKIPNPAIPAKLDIRFFRVQRPDPYWVLETDYTTYSVVLSCDNFFGFHTEIVWILSRSQSGLPENTKNSIYNTLQSYGIDTDMLKPTVQDSCS